MTTRTLGIPDYRGLDSSGEGAKAALRMDARGREPSSEALCDALVAPLIDAGVSRVLELGCGSGSLARRLMRRSPRLQLVAADKSEAMLQAARTSSAEEGLSGITLVQWDATQPRELEGGPFDLILSSVMVPYLTDAETSALVHRCRGLLRPGGRLAFLEQDLLSDSLNFPDYALFSRVFARDQRTLKPTLGLGLQPLLRDAGFTVEPRVSFLWTDDAYGPYTRELLDRGAEDALQRGRITPEERVRWNQTLEGLARTGDFYYGLVYHRVLGRAPG